MATRFIEIPDFDFTAFYYPEILRALIQYQRANVPEITDENENEPFQQLLRMYSLVGHLNNVNIDIVAAEALLPTARLLESVRGHLKLIDYRLSQASPATADLILEFSKVFNISTNVVSINSQFATEETEDNPEIIFENLEAVTIEPTDRFSSVYTYSAGRIKVLDNNFDGNETFTINGADFRNGIEWNPGATIVDTLNNIVTSINDSSSEAIVNKIFAISNEVDTVSLVNLGDTIETITLTLTDTATANLSVSNGDFGVDKSSTFATDSVLANMFDQTPVPGDAIYFGHNDVLWDGIEFEFDTAGSGISGVWEYNDGNLADQNPDDVTVNPTNLEFDLTGLLGTSDRSGTRIRVQLTATSAFEYQLSQWDGSKNVLITDGLLGQAVVSSDPTDYVVGTFWNEVSDLDDTTNGFTQNGRIRYTLPQNQTQNWQENTVNNEEAYWLRFRVISVSSPVNPIVDIADITENRQYLKLPVVQGETVAEDPVGSSNGAADLEFDLTYRPLIEESLIVEVNDGSGFQEWNRVDNFLNSTSTSKDYTLEIDANNIATIQFGDGTRGKIPTAGVDNIRALYRIGGDIDGNVGASTIRVNKSGVNFVNRIYNPRQATGWSAKEGSTDEDLARLKIEGPASLRTLGRAITPDDIETLAEAYRDENGTKIVERAKAIEETFGVKTIELVVVGPSGTLLTDSQIEDLETYFNGDRELGIEGVLVTNHEVTVVNYTPKIIDVTMDVIGGNAVTIRNGIVALLNPSATFDDGATKRWEFGQEVPRSLIIAEAFEVDPVAIKKVTLTQPLLDVQLDERELPLAGTVTVNVT